MKRIISLITALIVTFGMLPFTVQAEDEKSISKITVFGDSISAGYALEGYDRNDLSKAKDCFVNLLAEKYGLKYNNDIYNFSTVGKDSRSILASVKSTNKEIIKNSDVIVISAGGNDVIDTYGRVITDAAENEKKVLEENDILLNINDLKSLESTIISTMLNPNKMDFLNKFIESCSDDNAMKKYSSIPDIYSENIKKIISYIRGIGSNAEIILITPYDPLKTLPVRNKLADSVDATINKLGTNSLALTNDENYNDKLHVINLFSEFENRYFELTNITSLDIHPSVKGHKLISERVSLEIEKENTNTISLTQAETGNSSSSSAEKTQTEVNQTNADVNTENTVHSNPFSLTVTYILFSAALICGSAVIIDFLIKRSKEKKSGK